MHRHSSMNRVYRIVWNEALNIWVAVAENAKGRSKSSTGRKRLAALLALSSGLASVPFATAGPTDGIVKDGRTQTTVSAVGNTVNVNTTTVTGVNAYNSFSTFNVQSGVTANMYLPGGTSN
ncbi:MAG: ESPR-type extended signal peptide-containing protein, partial [Comamonadaceae bacterium]